MIKPMLAGQLWDHRDLVEKKLAEDGGVFFQPKLNGVRAVASKSGIFSRQGRRIMEGLHREMAPFFRDNPKTVLDGELWSADCKSDLGEVLSRFKREDGLQFCAFDVVSTEPQWQRLQFLSEAYEEGAICDPFSDQHPIAWIGTEIVKSLEQFFKRTEDCISEEIAEGGIMRFFDSAYEHKRSKSLLKLKFWEEFEMTVKSIGLREDGRVGALQCMAHGGNVLGCSLSNSAAYWAQWPPDSLVGKRVTVRVLLTSPWSGSLPATSGVVTSVVE